MDKKGAKYNFYSIHFQWYGRLWKPVVNEAVIVFFLSFLFHYFINEVRKIRKKLLNLQSQECQLQDKSSGLCHHQEDCDQQVCLEVELCCRWRICN